MGIGMSNLDNNIKSECSYCKGIGQIYDIVSRETKVCPVCGGSGERKIPKKGKILEKKDSEDIIANEIIELLKGMKEINETTREKLISVFRLMYLPDENVPNDLLDELDIAAHDSRIRCINRHDKLHGLTVCCNSLKLFDYFCFKSNSAKSHIKLQLIQRGKKIETALVAVMMSAFFHDICKCYTEHADFGAIIWDKFAEKQLANYLIPPNDKNSFEDMVRRCIKGHSGENEVTTLEESIVILADGLDNDKNRPQPDFDILTELSGKDGNPIEYFSCKEIQEVKIEDSENETITFCFMITGNGAIKKIWDFMKRLENTVFNSEENKDLVKVKIKYMNVEDHPHWKSDEIIIWPRPPQWVYSHG